MVIKHMSELHIEHIQNDATVKWKSKDGYLITVNKTDGRYKLEIVDIYAADSKDPYVRFCSSPYGSRRGVSNKKTKSINKLNAIVGYFGLFILDVELNPNEYYETVYTSCPALPLREWEISEYKDKWRQCIFNQSSHKSNWIAEEKENIKVNIIYYEKYYEDDYILFRCIDNNFNIYLFYDRNVKNKSTLSYIVFKYIKGTVKKNSIDQLNNTKYSWITNVVLLDDKSIEHDDDYEKEI